MAKKEKLIKTEVDMKKNITKNTEDIDDEVFEKILSAKEDPIIDAICPSCGKEVETHKCRLCGATKTINSVSGNVIWMRNGRVVKAFHDEKEAYTKMAQQYNISRDQWPEEFK